MPIFRKIKALINKKLSKRETLKSTAKLESQADTLNNGGTKKRETLNDLYKKMWKGKLN